MTLIPRSIFYITLLLGILSITHGLTALKYGNEIKDIYSVTGTCFNTEAATWAANQKFGSVVYSTCGGYGLVGGYGILKAQGDNLSKQYSALPTHTWIYYTMTIYAIDSWSYGAVAGGDDHFGLQFDSTPVDGFRFNVYTFYENICGNSWSDLRNIRVFGRIAHSATTSLTLKLFHYLDQDSNDESVGFREVNLIFANPSSGTAAICGTAPFKGFTGECNCPEGQYYSGGSCLDCHPNCESCFGASASQCYQCRPGTSWIDEACTPCATGCALCHGTADTDCDACLTGYYFYNSKSCIYPCEAPLVKSTSTNGCTNLCSSPCTTLTDYYYWDGTCDDTCDFPYRPNTINKYVKSCDFPCEAGSFVYWDGSCSISCEAPLTQSTTKGKLFCNFPCADTEFAYWNGTCATECLPPFKQSFAHGKQFCEYPCTGSEYLYWNGSCIATCDFPLSQKIDSGDRYCDYPCKNSEFLYWDGSCEADCPTLLSVRVEGSPRSRNYCDFMGAITDFLYWNRTYHTTCNSLFIQRTFKGRKLCEYPCAATEYLYWNGSCLADCDDPLETYIETVGTQFCKSRCSNPNDYLYWDNTCSSTCDSPLTHQTIGGEATPRKLCTYPCQMTEVLFYNGTCGSSCPSIFTAKPQNGQTVCQYPCDYTEFLYYNGLCKDNCPFPYALRKTNGLGFCDYPCSITQYLFWNGTCMSSCDLPLRVENGPDGEHFCNLPCDGPLDYYYVATGECKNTCDVRSRKEDDLYLTCLPPDAPTEPEGFLDLMLTPSAEPESPSLLVMNRFTQYLKYLDTSLPNRLETLSLSRAKNVISLKINIKPPAILQNWFAQRSLSSIVETQDINPSFIINFWGDIVLLVSCIIAALLFQLLEKIFKRIGHGRTHAFFEKLRLLTMWNLCFALIALNADDIIIYSYFEIKSVSLSTPAGSASLFVAILMVILVLTLLMLALYIVFRFRVFRKEAIEDKGDHACTEFHQGWKRFQVLYRGYAETSSLKQSFYIIYILRTAIPQAIMVGFVGSPKIQTIAQIAISGVIVAYIIILNPIKKRINQIQLVCLEVAGLVMNIAALILTTIPSSSDGTLSSSHTRTFLGDLIILGTLFINVVIVIFLVLKLLLATQELYKHFKANPKADKTVWLSLLVIPLQQGAFGFEELMGENLLDIDSKKANNPYGKFNAIYPEIASPISKDQNQDQEKPATLIDASSSVPKPNEKDEEGASPGLSTKNRNIERLTRVLRKKNEREGTLGDVREANTSPAFDLNVSPESSEIGTSFGFGSKLELSPTKSKNLLKGGSSHFDFDNKDDSPIRRKANRLQTLKLLTKKSEAS